MLSHRNDTNNYPSRFLRRVASLCLVILVLPSTAAPCSFSVNLGDGGSIEQSAVQDFDVAANAVTSCVVSCDSGSRTSLFLRYDGAAGAIFHDAADFNLDGCSLTLSLQSDSEETELGWYISVSNDFTNLKLTCSCSSPGTGNPDDGFGCFSEAATVSVLHKGVVTMKDLQVGDKVLTGKNQYQPVYAFGHHMRDQEQEFLQIYTKSNANKSLELTPDHMIFVSKNGQEIPTRADSLKVGDELIYGATPTSHREDTITRINTIQKKGVYMPLTPDGTILVNDLKVSTYISLSDKVPSVVYNSAYFGIDTEQTIHQWWLSPYRMLCMGVSSKFCSSNNINNNDNKKEQGILKWLTFGIDLLIFAEQQSFYIQVVVMGIPLFIVFALLNLLELMIGPTLAPSFIALLVARFVWLRRKRTARPVGLCKKKQL